MIYKEKTLTLLDIEEILTLQQKVVEKIENSDSFHPDTKEEIEDYIINGFAIGIYKQNSLVAYQVLKNPSKDNSLLYHLPDYISRSFRVFHFETTVVDPVHRGQGFQKKMKRISLAHLKIENRADIVCNTIHPFNYPSIKSSLDTGAKIVGIKKFYGGKIRFILFTPVNKNPQFSYNEKSIEIDLNNYNEISKMIKKGYVGHTVKESSILLSQIIKPNIKENI